MEEYYKDKYGNIHGPEVITPILRCMYVNLAKPSEYIKDKPQWGCLLVWDKTESPDWAPIIGVAKSVIEQHPKKKNFQADSFIKDGDERIDDEGRVKKDFAGRYYVSLSSSKPIVVLDRSRNLMDPASILGGMLIRARARVIASTPSGSFKVSLKPTAIQLVQDDGVRYGGSAIDRMFDDLPMEGLAEDDLFKNL
jgi:hypothetical protein